MLKTVAKLIAALMASVILSGCYLYPVEEEPIAPPLTQPQSIVYNTHAASLGIIEKTVAATARFRAESAADCKFGSRGGYVAERNVRVGLEVKKGDILVSLDTDDIDFEIKQATIDWNREQFNVQEAEKTSGRAARETAVAYAQFELDKSANRLNKLKADKEKSIVRAPITGVVSWVSSDVEVGRWVNANSVLCTIEDPTELVLDCTDSKISEFQMGMEVRVDYKREEYSGVVIMTPREAPEDAPERLKSTVRIDVPDITTKKRGDDARITVVLERREDVIVLPKHLVKNYLGQRFVQVLENDIRVQKDVEIGLENASLVEIVNGVEVGDLIIAQ